MSQYKCNNSLAITKISSLAQLPQDCSTIIGTGFNDNFYGTYNNATIYGEAGDDVFCVNGTLNTFFGDTGDDKFIILSKCNILQIKDFEVYNNKEKIDLREFQDIKSFNDIKIKEHTDGSIVETGSNCSIILNGIIIKQLGPDNFIFTPTSPSSTSNVFITYQSSIISGVVITIGFVTYFFQRYMSSKEHYWFGFPTTQELDDIKKELLKLSQDEGISINYLTTEMRQNNICLSTNAESVNRKLQRFHKFKDFAKWVEKGLFDNGDMINYMHVNTALSNYYLTIINDLESARKLLITTKELADKFLAKRLGIRDENVELKARRMYEDLGNDFTSEYVKVLYFLGRLNIRTQETLKLGMNFFNSAIRFNNKLPVPLFIGHLAEINLLIAQRMEREYTNQYDSKIILDEIEKLKKLSKSNTRYVVDIRGFGKGVGIEVYEDQRAVSECWHRILLCCQDLIKCKENVSEKITSNIEEFLKQVSFRVNVESGLQIKILESLKFILEKNKKISREILIWLDKQISYNVEYTSNTLEAIRWLKYQAYCSDDQSLNAQDICVIISLAINTLNLKDSVCDLKTSPENFSKIILVPNIRSTINTEFPTVYGVKKAIELWLKDCDHNKIFVTEEDLSNMQKLAVFTKSIYGFTQYDGVKKSGKCKENDTVWIITKNPKWSFFYINRDMKKIKIVSLYKFEFEQKDYYQEVGGVACNIIQTFSQMTLEDWRLYDKPDRQMVLIILHEIITQIKDLQPSSITVEQLNTIFPEISAPEPLRKISITNTDTTKISATVGIESNEPAHGTSSLKPYATVWHLYYPKGFYEILKLRTSNIHVHYPITDMQNFNNVLKLLNTNEIYKICSLIPVVLTINSQSRHWVGFITKYYDNLLDVTYIDPENTLIVNDFQNRLSLLLGSSRCVVHQQFVEEQKYSNNCGPELIENFAAALGFARTDQDRAVSLHSQLIEESLITEALCSLSESMPQVHGSSIALPKSVISTLDILSILEQNYVKQLKLLVAKGADQNLQELSGILFLLAKLHITRGRFTKDPICYTDSAKFLHYVLTINSLSKTHDTQDLVQTKFLCTKYNKIIDVYAHLDVISQELSRLILGSATQQSVYQEINKDRLRLEEFRARSKLLLEEIDDFRETIKKSCSQEEFQIMDRTLDMILVQKACTIFGYITAEMKALLADFYINAEQFLGTPPCTYTVIGFGSMALQLITPYSDLEFAILTENENYKNDHDPKIRNYFLYLTHLVHLRIINLGETLIPISMYGIDLLPSMKAGISFDLGGKTPLGRIDKSYNLIQTPEQMVLYFNNKYAEVDKILWYIIENCVYVYSSDNSHCLIEAYKHLVYKFLHTTDDSGVHYGHLRAIKILKNDLVKYNFIPKNSRCLKVKSELYRIDRFLDRIALYYGIQNNNIWKDLMQLTEIQIFSQTDFKHLSYAVSFVATLRLKTYLSWKGQVDEYPTSIFSLSIKKQTNDIDLLKYYTIVLPFQKKLKEFCNLNDMSKNKQFLITKTFDTDLLKRVLQSDVRVVEQRDTNNKNLYILHNSFLSGSWIVYYLKSFKYSDEIKQLKKLLRDKDIRMSWQDSLSSNNYKQVLFRLHPDKEGGTNDDFKFYNDFRQKFNKDDIEFIIQDLQLYIHKRAHQFSITFKALDFGVTAVRMYYKPTMYNIAHTAISGAYLLSMTTGVTKVSVIANMASVSHIYYEHGIYEAAKSAATLAVFMAVPYTLTFPSMLYVSLAYTVTLTVYTGINLANNIWSLYQELMSKDVLFESNQAYQEMYQKIFDSLNMDWFNKITDNDVVLENIKQELQQEVQNLDVNAKDVLTVRDDI